MFMKYDFDEVKGNNLYKPMLRYQYKHIPAETAKVTHSRHGFTLLIQPDHSKLNIQK